MKRTIGIFICLLAVVLLCACGNAATERPGEPVPETAPSAQAAEPAPETPAPETEPPFPPEQLERWAEDARALRLSELMIKNRTTLQDEDGDFSDWLELVNESDRALDLTDWVLSDKAGGKGGWTFPAVSLPAGERLLLFASGKDRTGEELHTDFSLSTGECLRLTTPDGETVFALDLPEAEEDCSLVAAEDGFAVSVWPTPGRTNDAEGYERCQQERQPSGPLVINEVVVDYRRGSWEGLQERDWVELKNVSDSPVQLSDYYLSDKRDDYLLWRLPDRQLEPGRLFLLVCSADGESYYPCAPFSLDSERECLFLSTGDRLCDRVSLHDVPLYGSCGRLDGEGGFYYFTTPTPERENAEGYRRVSAQPVCSLPGGVYEGGPLTVSLSAQGEIFYTLDGSGPSETGLRCEGPIEIGATTVLRAVSREEGALPSRPLTETFFLNEGHELPILSLVSDRPLDFKWMYDYQVKHFEIPGNLELYEDGGSFSIGCGITLSGQSSLELPKKNISVRFRGSYGRSKLQYDVFDGGVDEFESLAIRAGQDYYYALIRDELCQNLALAVSPDHLVSQRSKYCVLYVNGEYYGIYALKDKVTRRFYASWAGVGKDSVIVEEGPVSEWFPFGRDVCSLVFGNDMSDPDNYARFCEIADPDSFIDWLIMEGYCANPDILRGNVRYARSSEGDGKYRVIFYDLDGALKRRFLTFYNLLGSNERVQIQQISQILLSLLENEQFRSRFLERFSAAIYGPLSDRCVLAEIDRLYGQIESELPRDFARWYRDRYNFQSEFDYLRAFIEDDYAQYVIDTVCELLEVTEEERALYFPHPAS